MMQQLLKKSWRCVSQLFCCPLGASAEERTPSVQVVRRRPPTFLILNISNSNLTNCIIGNNSHLTIEAESQVLVQTPEQEMHGEEQSSSDQQGAAPTSPPSSPPPLPLVQSGTISICRSRCVIIGDYNSMHAETCDCHL